MSTDPRGVALRDGDRRILLKWHMLRRRPGDAAHARANLREGLARGAALEVDLQFTADGVGVCVHDETLDAETTGRGPVGAITSGELARLRQRGPGGEPLDRPPLLLEEVLAEVAEAAAGPGPAVPGAIQLDVKAPTLRSHDVDRFAALVRPLAERFTVAGEDWPGVERLAAAAPGVRAGFEPLRLFRDRPPREPAAFRALAARILAEAPGAAIVYLHTGLVLAGLVRGENLVARLVDAGKAVDCWTIDPHRTRVVDTLRRLGRAGCGQVTTNGPEALEALWTGG